MQSVNRHGTTPTQPQTDDTDTQNTVGKGADANPYLALAATLAAVHHGLTTEPELPLHTTGDAYQDADALPVPRDLGEALADFDDSKIAQNAFGATVVRHYAYAAQHEIDAHRKRVTDTELERGFLRA
ncbi:hypothetical protein HEP84_54550 [Streptomyces sp. RLB1-33]|nr:hypothetical protein [Streptomyces sp. RLB1-33]QIY76516.1 hypothetical protein HEP84_54550 [Streptomyces sp. RLB1-33]